MTFSQSFDEYEDDPTYDVSHHASEPSFQKELEEESFAAAEESFAVCLESADRHKTAFEVCYHFTNIPPSDAEVMVGKSTIEEKYYTSIL